MLIATYNIWDSEEGMPLRLTQIIDEIRRLDADIVCLQEAADGRQREIAKQCGYPYSCSALSGIGADWAYREENVVGKPDAGRQDTAADEKSIMESCEGIVILSRYPLSAMRCYPYGVAALIQAGAKKIQLINVHLPWNGARKRERAIANIVEQTERTQADYTILAGDFNCSEQSAVHRFLKGEQSLLGREACWFDLAEAHAECVGEPAPKTLNFRTNPRWNKPDGTGTNTIETNQRFDRILLKNPYPAEFPFLKDCGIFGTEVSDATKLSASDHYGVYAKLAFGD